MACKWYAEFEGVCCNGDCPERADICPYEDKQNECEYYEREGEESCKDCIHYDVCDIPSITSDINNASDCGRFKNKADFGKVVRCKKCKYKETCEQYLYIDSNRTELVYCSYGESK